MGISRREQWCLGLITAGLGATATLLWWNRNKSQDSPRLPGVIVIDGPFASGEFGVSQLKTDGLDANCPVIFKVCFEEEHGYCFVTVTFGLKKAGPPPRDIRLACAIIGMDGKVLESDYRAFLSKPAPPSSGYPGTSFNWPGREMIFELDGTTIRDIHRLEIIVS